MIEKIYARQLDNGLWQWRIRENDSWQNEGYFTGDNEALIGSVEQMRDVPVCLMLMGESCVSRIEVADVSNKNTLAKLLPYEMEDNIIDPIDDLHFVLGEVEDERVPVFYTHADKLEAAINNLSEVGCDVEEISPDYLLLKKQADEILIVWDESRVLLHFATNQGFAAETSIAQLYLKQMLIDTEKVSRITLMAENSDACAELKSWLPSEWLEEGGPEVECCEGGFWDTLDIIKPGSECNFRSGRFARQLPFIRWWQTWQMPTYFAAAAFVFALAVNFAMYSEAKSKYRTILDERKAVFLQAVPNGRWQTPEKELRARLGKSEGAGEPSDFLFLLEGVSKGLKTKESIALGSMRYSGDQRELVISFEAASFADVEEVRSAIESVGLRAETLRAAAQGNIFQARMKVAKNTGEPS